MDKTTMVLRVDASGRALRSGEQIPIGGNDQYVSVFRRHFTTGLAKSTQPSLTLDSGTV
jgi:thymidine kinase